MQKLGLASCLFAFVAVCDWPVNNYNRIKFSLAMTPIYPDGQGLLSSKFRNIEFEGSATTLKDNPRGADLRAAGAISIQSEYKRSTT
ncbi:hypothetical protein EDB85DRAFT_1097438 [Lactarius pseudohatsudake]|nr:hypothetical protein EDB85DRAFT_1097438 [Lactarius pseudohatsudake]